MASKQSSDVDEMIKSIKNNVGYKGYVILNTEGVVVRWDPMPYEQAVQHACLALDLYDKSKLSVNEIFETDGVESIRLRTSKHEVIIAQETNYTLIVVQADALTTK